MQYNRNKETKKLRKGDRRMSAIINTVGILLVAVGTIFTLWTVLATKKGYAGTHAEMGNRHKEFPKEKRRVIVGCVLIAIGSLLQIIGQWC